MENVDINSHWKSGLSFDHQHDPDFLIFNIPPPFFWREDVELKTQTKENLFYYELIIHPKKACISAQVC